jgi:hypothetical protein
MKLASYNKENLFLRADAAIWADVKQIVGQPKKSFLFHLASTPAQHTPSFDLQIDPANRRRKGPELAAACGRKMIGESFRTLCSPFFPPAEKANHTALGVSENPPNGLQRMKSREAICFG